jgi:predicted aspartyl protease
MMFRYICIASIFVSCIFEVHAAAAGDCKLKRVASIPITLTRNNRIVLDVTIDGESTKMLLDTGAAVSLLDEAFVNRRNLPVIDLPGEIYGLTGKQLHAGSRVSALTLGNTVAHDAVFRLGKVGGDGSDGGPVGLFGGDFLGNYDVEIDPSAARLNLFSKDHCTGNVVYWAMEYFKVPLSLTQGGQLEAPVTVNDKGLHGLIDTGDPDITMRLAVAKGVFDITPDLTGARSPGSFAGVDGTKLGYFRHSFESLTFGGITLHNTNMVIADIDSGKGAVTTGSHITGMQDQADLTIGTVLLRRLHLFIAYSEPALYFTLVEPAASAAN